MASANIKQYASEIFIYDTERIKVAKRLKELAETRDIERAYEQMDRQSSADDRYWNAEREERNASISRLYKIPFPHFVERFDEAMVLGDLYELMLEKPIGYYLMTVARMRYLQTVKTE